MIFTNGVPDTKLIDKDKLPKIKVTLNAYLKMMSYVQLSDTEISWLSHVTAAENEYIIDEAFIAEQEAAAATVSFTEKGLSKLCTNVIEKYGVDYYNEISLWGHSHVDMAASPSGQDFKQILEWKDQPYYIMLILNKKGRCYVALYDFKNNIVHENLPIQIDFPNYNEIRKESGQAIKDLVIKKQGFDYSQMSMYYKPDDIATKLPSVEYYKSNTVPHAPCSINNFTTNKKVDISAFTKPPLSPLDKFICNLISDGLFNFTDIRLFSTSADIKDFIESSSISMNMPSIPIIAQITNESSKSGKTIADTLFAHADAWNRLLSNMSRCCKNTIAAIAGLMNMTDLEDIFFECDDLNDLLNILKDEYDDDSDLLAIIAKEIDLCADSNPIYEDDTILCRHLIFCAKDEWRGDMYE